ncbi:MAG TPA: hypothetical protein VGC79_10190 [Polyangiaceae bacterium]
MSDAATTTANKDLLQKVRAGLTLKGTSLASWARANDVDAQNVRHALAGRWDGPKGRRIRAKVLREAGITEKSGR